MRNKLPLSMESSGTTARNASAARELGTKQHTTVKHVKGAGKGYARNAKDANPPTPGQSSASTGGTTESAIANLASSQPEPVPIDDDNTSGLFFV
jgi:hypothetical protein